MSDTNTSDTNTSDTNTSDTNTSDTKTIISSDPLVETYDNFISDKECSHFIEISKQHFKSYANHKQILSFHIQFYNIQ